MLRDKPLAINQSLLGDNSEMVVARSDFIFVWEWNAVVSSAKLIQFKIFYDLCNSLRYDKKNKGPSVGPYEIPV